ncbi:hypothetical protein BJV82DRAFT_520734, partial [Fennellomyces sp. T-0311]
ASHSLIMDPSDVAYQEHFNEAELEEIKTFNAPEVLPLPDKIAEFVNKFKGTDLKELEALVWSFKFDPVEEPDLRWIHVSIINALDLLHYEYTNKEHSGADLLKRVWSFIDGCFDATEILARSSEKTSESNSESVNKSRTDGSARKKIGTKVDLLFSTKLFELGALEAGKESDRSSTKSVAELHLKCPKTLKSIIIELTRISPCKIREIKTFGFVIAGMYLQSVVVDSPAGYVCRFNSLPDWLDYPLCPATFTGNFFQLIHLIWSAKQQMQRVQELVNSHRTLAALSYTVKRTEVIPPCFMPAPATHSKGKKRVRSEVDYNDDM